MLPAIEPPSVHQNQVKGELQYNGAGVRGLFATEDIAEGEPIMKIPPEAIINMGAGFSAPILNLLRELFCDGTSRYQPFIDSLPGRDAVLNECNMPLEYAGMLQMEVWYVGYSLNLGMRII